MNYNSFADERNMLINTLAFLRERFSAESNRAERGIIGREIRSVENRLHEVNSVMENNRFALTGYVPDSPPYAPDSPPYAPDSPPYAPDSPQYAPDSPTGSVRSLNLSGLNTSQDVIVDVDPTPTGTPNTTPPPSSPQVPSAPRRPTRRPGGTKKRKGKKRKTMKKKKSAKKGKKTKKR